MSSCLPSPSSCNYAVFLNYWEFQVLEKWPWLLLQFPCFGILFPEHHDPFCGEHIWLQVFLEFVNMGCQALPWSSQFLRNCLGSCWAVLFLKGFHKLHCPSGKPSWQGFHFRFHWIPSRGDFSAGRHCPFSLGSTSSLLLRPQSF